MTAGKTILPSRVSGTRTDASESRTSVNAFFPAGIVHSRGQFRCAVFSRSPELTSLTCDDVVSVERTAGATSGAGSAGK